MNAPIARRQLLGAIAIAPIAAIPAAPASAAPRWDALRTKYEAASATALLYYERVFEPEQERILSSVGRQPPLSFEHMARSGQVATFAVVPAARSPFAMPALDKLHDDAAAAWNAWSERDAGSKHDPRWRQAQDRMTTLFEVEEVARSRLMAEPAPHAAALAMKLKLALGDFDLSERDRLALLADAERLSR